MHLLVGFPSPWPAAFRKSVAGFFLHFSFEISIKNARFGRSLAQLFWAPCRYTLSRSRKDQNGASLAMYPLVDVRDAHALPSDSLPLARMVASGGSGLD